MLDNLHVEQIARGNRVAFKELHEELYGRMFYYVYKMLHDKEQSEDIIQEAFVLYWGNRVNFNSLLAVKAYLFSIVRNKVMAQIRDVPPIVSVFWTVSNGKRARREITC